jgi:hypothetical protein
MQSMVDLAQRLANLSPAQQELLKSRLKNKPQVAQPIAIVGMSCRLPGADDLDEFWKLIAEQRTAQDVDSLGRLYQQGPRI